MWGFTGLLTSVRDFLGVPLGAQYRPAGGSSDAKSASESIVKNMDLVKSIVSITVDDVCIGSNPFYYKTKYNAANMSKDKFDAIQKELNSISKWIAYDLLVDGVSTYKIVVRDKHIYIYPILGDVKIILNSKKEIVVFDQDDHKITDCLAFVNYDKRSLTKIEDKNYEYRVDPRPVQLDNVEDSAKDLVLMEKSLLRYRRDLSKILRFVTVEVGTSQGDKQQDLLDNVGSGINANSISLEASTADLFDDEIPVFPTRKGLGKPEVSESISSADVKSLVDLDYIMGKVFLAMKFPKTYADFQTSLDATAVSLIRGDIRYSRMLKTTRTLMENSVNFYFGDLKESKKYGVEFKMQEIPNPEDQEVIDSLTSYQEFLSKAFDDIVGQSETVEEALYKLDSYQCLLGDSSNLKSIESWIQLTKKFVKLHFNNKNLEDNETNHDQDNPDLNELDDPESEDSEDPDLDSDESEDKEEKEQKSPEAREFAPGEKPDFT